MLQFACSCTRCFCFSRLHDRSRVCRWLRYLSSRHSSSPEYEDFLFFPLLSPNVFWLELYEVCIEYVIPGRAGMILLEPLMEID